MPKYAQLAELAAATAYLNSLWKEWPGAEATALPEALFRLTDRKAGLKVDVGAGRALWLPLDHFSQLGRHRYSGQFFLEEAGSFTAVGFGDLRTLIGSAISQAFGGAADPSFEARVRASQSVMEETLRSAAPAGPTFLAAEQGLKLGHSFHPTPKSRDEFSPEDAALYSPELGGRFPLAWYLVKAPALAEEHVRGLGGSDWLSRVFSAEVGEEEAARVASEGWHPLPAHPWQKQRLENNPAVRGWREQGLVTDHPGGKKLWSATSSLRTIYREGAPYMLKFSLSLKLTNSVRHITEAELRRGLQATEVFASPPARAFFEACPEFHFLGEPAFVGLRTPEGKILAESLVVARDNPFAEKDPVCVVATLAQENPLGGESLLASAVREAAGPGYLGATATRWFDEFLRVAIRPVLLAESQFGIILGAHQQNLLLRLEEGWPTGAYFRDSHGTGYTALGVELFRPHVSLLAENNGNLVPERMGHVLFAYYLVLNSVFNVISALSADGWVEESVLLFHFRRFLQELKNTPGVDAGVYRYLLEEPELLHKGNFLCTWRRLNENTVDDPLAIYTPIPNPLREKQ